MVWLDDCEDAQQQEKEQGNEQESSNNHIASPPASQCILLRQTFLVRRSMAATRTEVSFVGMCNLLIKLVLLFH